MSLKPLGLRSALLRYLAVPLALLWVFSAVTTYMIAKRYVREAFDRSLLDSVETIEEQIKIRNGHAVLELPSVAWEILGFDSQDKVYYDVRRVDGTILAGDVDIPDPPHAQAAGQSTFQDGEVRGEPVRIVSLFVVPRGLDRGEGVLVQVAETLHKWEAVQREILLATLLPQMALILLTILSVWFGIHRSLLPLKRLHDAIERRSHRDLSPVTEPAAPGEVRPLLAAVNDLMRRLDQVLTAQRHFVSDAAHQLRTPLAALATQAELALSQVDPAVQRRSLEQLQIAAERTSHLVQQLLALARAEAAPGLALPREPVDLDALARQMTADWVPQALHKQIDLGYEGPGQPVMVTGQKLMLNEMLANVIDNAIRYTPVQGQVTVQLGGGDTPRLSVEDNGPGIPPEQRQRVFERFYRLPDNAGEGSGLGLAIVREIAVAHGAEVSIDTPRSGRGTRLTITFGKHAALSIFR